MNAGQRKEKVMIAAIINITAIICFTVLAIHFDKWWIVLFSAFFMFSQTSHRDDDKNDKEGDVE